MTVASSRKDRTIKLAHRSAQCPPKTYRGNSNPNIQPAIPRSLMFERIKQEVDRKVKSDVEQGKPALNKEEKLSLVRRTFRMIREQMKQEKA